MQSQPSVVADGTSNGSAEPLSDLLSLGRAAVQSLQPDAAEAEEMAQLVTPLVLGKRARASIIVTWFVCFEIPRNFPQLPKYHANSAFPSLLQLSLAQVPLLFVQKADFTTGQTTVGRQVLSELGVVIIWDREIGTIYKSYGS